MLPDEVSDEEGDGAEADAAAEAEDLSEAEGGRDKADAGQQDEEAVERQLAAARAAEQKANETRQQYLDRLQETAAKQPEPPSETMLDPDHENYDLNRYLRESAKYDKAINAQRAADQKLQEETGKFLAERNRAIASSRVAGVLADPEKGTAAWNELARYAQSQGYDANQLARNASASDIETLYKAMKYDALSQKTGRRETPKVVKPGTAGAKPQNARLAELEARMKKGGKDGAKAALEKARLNRELRAQRGSAR